MTYVNLNPAPKSLAKQNKLFKKKAYPQQKPISLKYLLYVRTSLIILPSIQNPITNFLTCRKHLLDNSIT